MKVINNLFSYEELLHCNKNKKRCKGFYSLMTNEVFTVMDYSIEENF